MYRFCIKESSPLPPPETAEPKIRFALYFLFFRPCCFPIEFSVCWAGKLVETGDWRLLRSIQRKTEAKLSARFIFALSLLAS